MENRKKIVHLTEGQLHNVIKESVKQVLSELDWKTYMNAARKSYEPGPKYQTYGTINGYSNRNARSRKFVKAAEDALNRDFGYEKEYNSGNKGKLRFSTPHNLSDTEYDDRMGREATKKAHFVASKTYADGGRLTDVGPRGGWGYNDHSFVEYDNPDSPWGVSYDSDKYLPKSDIYKGDRRFRDAIDRGERELNDYHNSNYEYEPNGRGWHLKK